MIDYIYSDVLGLSASEFYENELLNFCSNVALKTGELSPNIDRGKHKFRPKDEKVAYLDRLKFYITNDKHINLEGSLHEYTLGDNSSDFSFPQLYSTIKDLHGKFKINPFRNVLHNVEFGVNIITPLPVKVILDSIISLKGKEYNRENFNGKGDLIRFIHKQFELKIYDKGKQKGLDGNILRIEIKVRRMEFLRKKGIHIFTTADLLDQDIHRRLGEQLLAYIRHLIIYDNGISLDRLPEREKALLKDGQNPRYWKDLKKFNPENFKKKVPRFNELVSIYSTNQIKATLLNLTEQKWNDITQIDQLTFYQVVQFLDQLKPVALPKLTA